MILNSDWRRALDKAREAKQTYVDVALAYDLPVRLIQIKAEELGYKLKTLPMRRVLNEKERDAVTRLRRKGHGTHRISDIIGTHNQTIADLVALHDPLVDEVVARMDAEIPVHEICASLGISPSKLRFVRAKMPPEYADRFRTVRAPRVRVLQGRKRDEEAQENFDHAMISVRTRNYFRNSAPQLEWDILAKWVPDVYYALKNTVG